MGCGVSKTEKETAEVPEHLLATQMAMNGLKVNHVVLMEYFFYWFVSQSHIKI